LTIRSIARFRHPRTGITVYLLPLPATAELMIFNLISQHDPQPDSEFASDRQPGLPQTFLQQFASVKTLQLRIPAYSVCRRLTPEKPQQRIALFAQPAEPLPPPLEYSFGMIPT
jgi:hypothetical protein